MLFPSCMKRSILSQDNMSHDGGWMNEWRSRSQNQNNIATMLRVAVSSAVNLPNVETIGKSDPYVVLTFQGLYLTCSWPVCRDFCVRASLREDFYCPRWGERETVVFKLLRPLKFNWFFLLFLFYFLGVKKKTEVIKDELNPVWNEVNFSDSQLVISTDSKRGRTANMSLIVGLVLMVYRLFLRGKFFLQPFKIFFWLSSPEIRMGLRYTGAVCGGKFSSSCQRLGAHWQESVSS